MSHTPGPWKAKEKYNRPGEFVVVAVKKPTETTRLEVRVDRDGSFNEKDAHLIASAPTLKAENEQLKATNAVLLAALKNTMNTLRYLRDSNPKQYDALVTGCIEYLNMWDKNKATIAQAEGREK